MPPNNGLQRTAALPLLNRRALPAIVLVIETSLTRPAARR
jgi:hypothetical protein